jgi:hypothetical protein
MITLNSLSAAQGYGVVLNDMHGKQKRVTTYEYTPEWNAAANDYKFREDPIEETEWTYHATGGFGGGTSSLANSVTVMTGDAVSSTNTLAQESELAVDLRSNRTEAWDAGININTDVIFAIFPIPIPVPIPNFGYSLSETKTVVTSRVVHQSGIMQSVRTRQGSARFERRNRAYDPMTARALLVEEKTFFGDPVYEYTLSGRWKYPRLGTAYEEIGRTYALTGATVQDGRTVKLPAPGWPVCSDDPATRASSCVPLGTEFVAGTGSSAVRLTLVASGSDGSTVLATDRPITAAPSGDARIVRSGDRNELTTAVGSIRALSDPTQGRGQSTCRWTERYPCGDCTIRESVPAPVCEVVTLFEAAQPGRKSRGKAGCAQSDADWRLGRPTTGGIEFQRGRKKCKIVARNESGRSISGNDLHNAEPVVVETSPLGAVDSASGLAYTGLALRGRDGKLIYIYSDCGGFIGTVERTRTEVAYCDREQTRTFTTIPDVLDIAQSTFRDYWPNADDDVRFAGTRQQMLDARAAFDERDEFARGVRGIFRPWKQFAYVDDRRQSTSLDLRTDGAFNTVLFEGDGTFPEVCGVKWRQLTEFVRYSGSSFETEERNALGVSASSLYGLRGRVPIAVANNAGQDEIGFEGFEAYAAGATLTREETGEGNLTFYTREATVAGAARPELEINKGLIATFAEGKFLTVRERTTNVKNTGGARSMGGEAFVRSAMRGDVDAEVQSVTLPGIPCPIPVEPIGPPPDGQPPRPPRGPGGDPPPEGDMILVLGDSIPFCPELDPQTLKQLVAEWKSRPGREIDVEVHVGTQFPTHRVAVVSVSSTKAHTGKRSLRVAQNSEFNQTELVLTPGRRYLVSGWISREATDVPTFRRAAATNPAVGLQVRLWSGTTEMTSARPQPFEPDGPIIDGWQRIEGVFQMPGSNARVSLEYLSGSDNPGTVAYFDDVRVLQEDGSLETFVYDMASAQMTAQLDENNFATFYGHAPVGRVELIRRETVMGILTQRENRVHMRERP